MAYRIVALRQGQQPLDLTALVENPRWSSAAVGGFADFSCDLPGDLRELRAQIPPLTEIRVSIGPRILYEGRVEDRDISLNGLSLKAFGAKRRLEQTSVQRIWTMRTLSWAAANTLTGGYLNASYFRQAGWLSQTIGQYEQSDLTKVGVRLTGNGSNAANNYGDAAQFVLGNNNTIQRFMADYSFVLNSLFLANSLAIHISYSDGSNWAAASVAASVNNGAGPWSTSGSWNVSVPNAGAVRFGVGNISGGSINPGTTDHFDISNVRALGTSLTEDTAGGFYGGTILRDLIALVPELTIGTIETGSDFTIENIERSVRGSALSVVEETAGYYGRRWGVWESGRFDWKTVTPDEPQWLVAVDDLADLRLTETVDNLVRTIYLSYVDATTVTAKTVTASSTDPRNPYVKAGQAKDAVAQVSFLMTPNSAQQLANKLVADQGGFPPISGRLVLPSERLVKSAVGSAQPAYAIRGGDTIYISGLPKSEPLRPGRDGETLFLVAAAEVDTGKGLVTLEIDGYQRRSEVLLARLAAVTRTVSG